MPEDDQGLLISPTDFRYRVEGLTEHLSEEAFIQYKARVELEHLRVLRETEFPGIGEIPPDQDVLGQVTHRRVRKVEKDTRHDIVALVRVLRNALPDEIAPYVHLGLTSSDIVDTANALRLRDAVLERVVPWMENLAITWAEIADGEARTPQVGRTHGQYAEPVTVGFTFANYLDRWASQIERLKSVAEQLPGKLSGPVGSYGQLSLVVSDPRAHETAVLERLGLAAPRCSRQIVHPEPVLHLLHELMSAWGILANFSDDMRHLMRSEIGEVRLVSSSEAVGSSSMPQKENPVPFESVKSAWKTFLPRMQTVYMDQVSEHQRDLTDSLSSRYVPEMVSMFAWCLQRIQDATNRLELDRDVLDTHLALDEEGWMGPLATLLSANGVKGAREKVLEIRRKSMDSDAAWTEVAAGEAEVERALDRFGVNLEELEDPLNRIGEAPAIARHLAAPWLDQRSQQLE